MKVTKADVRLAQGVYPGWFEEMRWAKKKARCAHELVLWDATGKVGICIRCGATVKRQG